MTRSTHQAAQSTRQSLGAPAWMLLILSAVLPASFASGLSHYEALKELLFIGGVGVALVMWGAGSLRRGRLSVAPARVALLGVLFALYTLGAALGSDPTLWGLWEALQFGALGAALLIIAAPIGRALGFREVALASALGALVASVCGFLDLAGVELFRMIWEPVGPTGAFDAMEFGAAYLVVVLPVIWGGAITASGVRRVFLGFSFLVSTVYFAMLAGWLWAGFFALVCVFAALLVGALRRPLSLRVLVPALGLSAIVGVVALGVSLGFGPPPAPGPANQLPRLMHAQPVDASGLSESAVSADEGLLFSAARMESVRGVQARSYLLAVGATMVAKRPLLGGGPGAWWREQTASAHSSHDYIIDEFELYPAFRSPHNAAIKLLVEYGAVGFLLFALWVLAAFAVALSGLMRRGEQDAEQDGPEAKDDAHSTRWVVEHWAMLSAAIAGLVFMFFTPLLSLAPAALGWVVSLGILARVSAEYNGFSGWSDAWHAGTAPDAIQKGATMRKLGALLAMAVGVGGIILAGLNAGAVFYRGQAEQWMRAADYERAIEAYQSAHRWYPAAGDGALNIGLASARLGRLEQAEEWVERAVQMRPYDVRALTLKGRLRLRDPDPARAVELGNQAVAAFPNSVAARNLLIAGLILQRRYKEAVEQAEAMIARQPPASHRVELEELIAQMQSEFLNNPAQAKVHYEQALKFSASRPIRRRFERQIEQMERSMEAERQRLDGDWEAESP